jgi:NADH-quinone oxidoreductase subunit L
MTIPLIVLGALSVVGGALILNGWIVDWLAPVVGEPGPETPSLSPLLFSLIVVGDVAIGATIAWFTVGARPVPRTAPQNVSALTRAARADLYGDAFNEEVFMRPGDQFVNDLVGFDDNVLDASVDGTGGAFGGMSMRLRRWQNGFVRSYALSLLGGAVVVVVALLAVNLA